MPVNIPKRHKDLSLGERCQLELTLYLQVVTFPKLPAIFPEASSWPLPGRWIFMQQAPVCLQLLLAGCLRFRSRCCVPPSTPTSCRSCRRSSSTNRLQPARCWRPPPPTRDQLHKLNLPGKLILSKRKGLWEVLFS